MRIVRLTSENVKRISAVEITPDPMGAIVTVAGKNGAGKSSVLDSIAYALGGEKLVPSQPIRTGEASAKIVVDLGDYIVTRRFYRDRMPCDCGVTSPGDMPIVGDDVMHTTECAWRTKFGPTKSTLAVTNREGAKYPSPQILLDKIYGKLTFDPLAFSREKPDKQNEILRRLVNLDFSLLNARRKTAFDVRAMDKKTLSIAAQKLGSMTQHTTAPAAEIPVETVSAEIKRGQELQRVAEEAVKAADGARESTKKLEEQKASLSEKIYALRHMIKELEESQAELDNKIVAARPHEQALAVAANEAKAAVPDFAVLDARLKEIDTLNRQVRDNAAYNAQYETVKNLELAVKEFDVKINDIDTQKETALKTAQFPVPGLGLTDEGVTFEGLPLEEVSTSVQLRVSIATGLALNPTLKILLIRNGNLLDDDSIKVIAEQAEAAGAQIWMEYVTSSSEGVSVMLEDGHVAS